MELSSGHAGREEEIVTLFASTFAASEGVAEGESIRGLASDLLGTTPADDLFVCCAHEGPTLLGAIVFSRLRYDQDRRTVFVLAPVAVRTDRQGTGIGQQLLTYGLEELRSRGVDTAVTYGDPTYYSKVGFRQISPDVAQAPFPLRYPHGWLAQSLTHRDLEPVVGPCRCVPALDSPEYW